MLSARTGRILKHIIEQYIERAAPVSSQSIANKAELGISSATIRNEMAYLEHEGYLIRPHISAGCVPSDEGYRYYVTSLENIKLPTAQQFMISHLFHQVENEVENWLRLAATLLAQLAQNMAVVGLPKTSDCKLKHLEMVSLKDTMALLVVVLYGAKVKQKLITSDRAMSQPSLTAASNKLNALYPGLTSRQISAKEEELSPIERQIIDYLIEIMQAEDEQEYEDPYLDGMHFIINQPEFVHSDRMQPLMNLVEQRKLLKVIVPSGLNRRSVQVVIGKENKAESIQNYSVVIGQYGLPDEAAGTIGVIGPTRMPYSSTITTVDYLSAVLSELVAGLYGKEAKSG